MVQICQQSICYFRIPSAQSIGIGKLVNKKMVLNKKGADGSGKANIVDFDGFDTWGVLYEVNENDLLSLDNFENGYSRVSLQAQIYDNPFLDVDVYISSELTGNLFAQEWYKEIIILGAKEHNLPENYITYLSNLPSKNEKLNLKSK